MAEVEVDLCSILKEQCLSIVACNLKSHATYQKTLPAMLEGLYIQCAAVHVCPMRFPVNFRAIYHH